MTTYRLSIDTDGAAFHDEDAPPPEDLDGLDPDEANRAEDAHAAACGRELARLLGKVAQRLSTDGAAPCHAVSIHDANGNRVGQWKITADE